MRKEPRYFSIEDFFRALFGGFIVGLTFLFKGSMLDFAKRMDVLHIVLVLLLAFVIVTIEIYILSYRYVYKRDERPFSEFWTKRFFAITISSFLSLYIAVYAYGLYQYVPTYDLFKLVVAVFLPTSIAGAAMEMLKSEIK